MRSMAFVGVDEGDVVRRFADRWRMLDPKVRRKWSWRAMPLAVVDNWKDWPEPKEAVHGGQPELPFMGV